jgi:hypothetical protein
MATWILVIAFLPALFFYFEATISTCWDSSSNTLGCNVAILAPWVLIAIASAAYSFIVWNIHELGHENLLELHPDVSTSRYAWAHAKLGYMNLNKGYHHHVRHAHRVATVALAGVLVYASFQYFEADTLTNLIIAATTYVVIGELLNWKTYETLLK